MAWLYYLCEYVCKSNHGKCFIERYKNAYIQNVSGNKWKYNAENKMT